MQTLVIGYGSIGARHARLLKAQGHDVACVTRNPDSPFPTWTDLARALDATSPELVIISNPTADHLQTLETVLDTGYSGYILIEKPLFDSVPESLPSMGDNVFVAYNLRFHPMITRVRELTQGRQLYSARLHVGQYLPDWRPGTDYTQCYSAKRSQGGGVLRDLSHELDLARWLLGPWKHVSAIGGRFSNLAIDSDDVVSIIMETESCPAVSIHMDYLNRPVRRAIEINGQDISVHADLIAGTLNINGDIENFLVERDATYEAQLWTLASKQTGTHCTFAQGMDLLRLIQAIETSAAERKWVSAS